jgi:hypothetical protein
MPKTKLKIYCERHGRSDLYEPLSRLLLEQPEKNISEASETSYPLPHVSVLIYQGRTEEAKKMYDKFYNSNPTTYSYIKPVIDGFDDVVKIAKDYWLDLAEDEYAELLKKIEMEKAKEIEVQKKKETSKSKP